MNKRMGQTKLLSPFLVNYRGMMWDTVVHKTPFPLVYFVSQNPGKSTVTKDMKAAMGFKRGSRK